MTEQEIKARLSALYDEAENATGWSACNRVRDDEIEMLERKLAQQKAAKS